MAKHRNEQAEIVEVFEQILEVAREETEGDFFEAWKICYNRYLKTFKE